MNTSRFCGGAWMPEITGVDEDDNEYAMELDLYAGAKKNWEQFKSKYPEATAQRKFYCEYREAAEKTDQARRNTR